MNHVFAAQTIDGDSNRYHTAPNGQKPDDYFHGPDCCTSSGQRQISMIPQFIYAATADAVIVNQFVPSTASVNVGSTKLTLVQDTAYPESETVRLRLSLDQASSFELKVRMPGWCESPRLKVNGQAVGKLTPGTYWTAKRQWKTGDEIELSLPMKVRWVEHDHFDGRTAPHALVRGPVVYALDTVWWDSKTLKVEPPRDVAIAAGVIRGATPHEIPPGPRSIGPFFQVPVTIAGQLPGAPPTNAVFVPFSNIGRWYAVDRPKPDRHSRAYSYAVWLFDSNSEPFKANAAAVAKEDAYRSEAIDYVLPLDASERAHELKHDRSNTGHAHGRAFRDGKSFGYLMKVSTEVPTELRVMYWSGEAASCAHLKAVFAVWIRRLSTFGLSDWDHAILSSRKPELTDAGDRH